MRAMGRMNAHQRRVPFEKMPRFFYGKLGEQFAPSARAGAKGADALAWSPSGSSSAAAASTGLRRR